MSWLGLMDYDLTKGCPSKFQSAQKNKQTNYRTAHEAQDEGVDWNHVGVDGDSM